MPRLESYPSPNCWWSSFVCPWRTRGSAFSSYFLPTPALNSNSRILVHAGADAAGKGLHHQCHGHLVGDDEPCGVFGVISWPIDKHIYLCMFYIHLLLIVLSTCNFIEIFEVWASILPVDIIYWRWWYLCNIFGLRYIASDILHFWQSFLPDVFIEDTVVWGRYDFAQRPTVNDIMQVEVTLNSGRILYKTRYNLAFSIFLWKVFPEWFLWDFLACLASRLARYWVEKISANSSSSGVNIAGQQSQHEKGSSKFFLPNMLQPKVLALTNAWSFALWPDGRPSPIQAIVNLPSENNIRINLPSHFKLKFKSTSHLKEKKIKPKSARKQKFEINLPSRKSLIWSSHMKTKFKPTSVWN